MHCSVFSAPTFPALWQGLAETSLLPLNLQEVGEAGRNGNEFWALLRARPQVDPSKRRPARGRKFVEGTDGYLFLDNDTNRTMDQMTGAAPLSGSVLGQWRRTLRARQVAMNDLGVDYRLVIAPAKEAALDAQLPAGVTLSERRPARQIAAEPKLAEIVCYPLQALRDLAAAGAQPYPRGDSHFSDAGAYAVYAETMRALNRIGDVLPTWRLKRGESEVIGDLMLNSPNRHADKMTTLTPSPALATTVFNNNRQNRGRIVKTHNPSARLGTLLMFRDSFAETLIPFFAETFKSCIFVWRPYVDFDLVEETRPDVVLNVMAERFLPVVPDDSYKLSLEDLTLIRQIKE